MGLVNYALDGGVATIAMDDGKVNALSPAMLGELNAAFDRAEADRAVVVVTGREGVFSAGFDLKVLRGGGPDGPAMVQGGFDLAMRVLAFPFPVVMACSGHAIAMGLFLLESGDYVVGADGSFKFTANEVAIGLEVPPVGLAVLRQRVVPAVFNRMTLLAEPLDPSAALAAGVLDQVVAPLSVLDVARSVATSLLPLDMAAYAATKRSARPVVV
jgi:enoyl-CoA hydratase